MFLIKIKTRFDVSFVASQESPVAASKLDTVVIDDSLSIYKVRLLVLSFAYPFRIQECNNILA